MIKAFDMGVATMKLGERCFLTCAPNYAYGAAGSPPAIPPDATLIFEVGNAILLVNKIWKIPDFMRFLRILHLDE